MSGRKERGGERKRRTRGVKGRSNERKEKRRRGEADQQKEEAEKGRRGSLAGTLC